MEQCTGEAQRTVLRPNKPPPTLAGPGRQTLAGVAGVAARPGRLPRAAAPTSGIKATLEMNILRFLRIQLRVGVFDRAAAHELIEPDSMH
ncbi:MAG: hypothetical protein Fur005_46230 [Roseiflexaceae bacterium]